MESHKYQGTFNSSKIVANRGVHPLVKRKIKINTIFVHSVHVNKLPNRRRRKLWTNYLPFYVLNDAQRKIVRWKIAALDFCKSHFTKKKKENEKQKI